MNLHDIRYPRVGPDRELVLRFMSESEYPQWQWQSHPTEDGAIQFRSDAYSDWDTLDSRATLSYLNRALRWAGLPERDHYS